MQWLLARYVTARSAARPRPGFRMRTMFADSFVHMVACCIDAVDRVSTWDQRLTTIEQVEFQEPETRRTKYLPAGRLRASSES